MWLLYRVRRVSGPSANDLVWFNRAVSMPWRKGS
jgi:hypothetical protein